MLRSITYGKKTPDCETPLIPVPCYEPCEHTNYVISNSLPLIGSPIYLESLIRGQLAVAEQFLAELCLPLDICKQGEILGFPCIQCDYIIQSASTTEDPDIISCGDCQYTIIDPCREPATESGPFYERCILGIIDFSTATEELVIYETIIASLTSFDGNANWLGIEQMAKLIFGANSKVIKFSGGNYYVYIGPYDPIINNLLIIIEKIMPNPIGTNIIFVTDEIC